MYFLAPNLTEWTWLSPQQIDESWEGGWCFICDINYGKGHKCCEKKLFYIDCEEEQEHELEPSQYLELEETTPTISYHSLGDIGIVTHQKG